MDRDEDTRTSRPPMHEWESPGCEPVSDPAALRRFMSATRGAPCPDQLTLAGMGSQPRVHVPSRVAGERDPLGYGLFFAGFAEPEDGRRLCLQGGSLARRHGLRDALQLPERAHVTLCSLNKHHPLNQDVIDAARAAAQRFPCPALPMVFDRACSFAANGAFMLLGNAATNSAIAKLQRPLMSMLRRFGLKPGEVRMPHMTMVYNCGQVVAEQPMAPLAWTMRRFALVLSHIGNARHEYLGEWALPRP